MYVIWFDKFIPILSFLYLSQRKKTTKKNSLRVIWQDFQIVNLSRIQKPTVMLKTSMLCWMEFWEWFLCGILCKMIVGSEMKSHFFASLWLLPCWEYRTWKLGFWQCHSGWGDKTPDPDSTSFPKCMPLLTFVLS